MSFKDEFGDWASETIKVETYSGTGGWGDSFTVATDVECWFQYDNRLITAADGSTIVSEAQVFAAVDHRATLTLVSKVALPNDEREYKVARVRTWPGDDPHLEVWLV